MEMHLFFLRAGDRVEILHLFLWVSPVFSGLCRNMQWQPNFAMPLSFGGGQRSPIPRFFKHEQVNRLEVIELLRAFFRSHLLA